MSNKYCVNTVDYPVLSKEDTRSLFNEYKNGKDASGKKAAFDKLVYHNMGIVYATIERICHTQDPDLVSFGVEGLIDAIEKFDPSKDANLGSYAYIQVFKCVLKGYREKTRSIGIPEEVSNALSKFNRAMRDFEETNGFTPSYRPFSDENDGIMSDMERELSQVFDLKQYKRVVDAYETTFVSSLDYTIDDGEGSSIAFVDTIAAPVSYDENMSQSFEAALDDLRKNCKDGETIVQIFDLLYQKHKGPSIEKILHISRSTYRTLLSRGREYLLNSNDFIRESVNF